MMIYELPKNVRILTLEPWRDGEVLLRLEHIFEKDEAPNYSIPVEISLKVYFIKLFKLLNYLLHFLLFKNFFFYNTESICSICGAIGYRNNTGWKSIGEKCATS